MSLPETPLPAPQGCLLLPESPAHLWSFRHPSKTLFRMFNRHSLEQGYTISLVTLDFLIQNMQGVHQGTAKFPHKFLTCARSCLHGCSEWSVTRSGIALIQTTDQYRSERMTISSGFLSGPSLLSKLSERIRYWCRCTEIASRNSINSVLSSHYDQSFHFAKQYAFCLAVPCIKIIQERGLRELNGFIWR